MAFKANPPLQIFAALLFVQVAFAQEASDTGSDQPIIEEVIVVAHPLGGSVAVHAASIIDADELIKQTETSIGATINHLPGMNTTSFGEAVGRPVIHGLGAARVQVLEDELDTLDASTNSVDHAVTTEAVIAKQIEVLKGPFSLVYGSGAVGGVVDVVTNRIPRDFEPTTIASGELRTADNGSRVTYVGALDSSNGQTAWHVDGYFRSADPYEIPGEAESEYLHELEGGEESETEEHDEEMDGLAGTQYEVSGVNVGASYRLDDGYVGISFGLLGSEYGLPGHLHLHEEHEEEEEEEGEHHEEEEEEEEAIPGYPLLDLSQSRVGFVVNKNIDGFAGLNEFTLRSRISDYQHDEIEEPGHVGTTFSITGHDTRLELRGTGQDDDVRLIGLHLKGGEYSVVGEEAFVPTVELSSIGVFAMAERPIASGRLEGGVRIGRDAFSPQEGQDETFATWSLSVGALLPLNESGDSMLSIEGDLASRGPTKEELYSNGPHLATRRFEIGNSDLDNERVQSILATFSSSLSEQFEVRSTAYAYFFANFIAPLPTGAEEDDLPVYRYQKADGRYTGLDLSGSYRMIDSDRGSVTLNAMYDTVTGKFTDDDTPLPLVPPSRLGVGIEVDYAQWELHLDVLNVMDQDDPSVGELPTDGYLDVHLWVSKSFELMEGNLMTIFVKGSNLTDEEQRRHTSLLKDLAPIPGRTIEAGFRYSM